MTVKVPSWLCLLGRLADVSQRRRSNGYDLLSCQTGPLRRHASHYAHVPCKNLLYPTPAVRRVPHSRCLVGWGHANKEDAFQGFVVLLASPHSREQQTPLQGLGVQTTILPFEPEPQPELPCSPDHHDWRVVYVWNMLVLRGMCTPAHKPSEKPTLLVRKPQKRRCNCAYGILPHRGGLNSSNRGSNKKSFHPRDIRMFTLCARPSSISARANRIAERYAPLMKPGTAERLSK